MSFDNRIRYFHAHLGDDKYGIEEGHSKELIDPGPYTYEEALGIADRQNDIRAQERIKALDYAVS